MSESNSGSYRFVNQEQSLSVLNQASKHAANGCLQLFTASHYWYLYLEHGKLIYVCSSDGMFELIYRKLQQLSQEIARVFQNVYQGLKESFSDSFEKQSLVYLDYWAICWLVNHKLISDVQAGIIIGELALEIFPLLLKIESGFYRLSHGSILHKMPRFCHLDIRFIISRSFNSSINQNNIDLSVILEHTFKDFYEEQHPQETNVQPISSVNHNSKIADTNDELAHHRQDIFHNSPPHKLYKIICIDDSPTMLHIIKSFLDEEFFAVELVDEPLKSLMQIIRTKPDLILLDIYMPNLDGYQLCSWIRRNSDFKNTPVIMVTGKTGFINRAKAKLVGATGYLTKPFTQEQLLEILMKHLS
ncbi:MAG: response regulator [Calothrix sp. MO_192.B10]|nr:response regulator [Calothrix sp. MO_192.B10]